MDAGLTAALKEITVKVSGVGVVGYGGEPCRSRWGSGSKIEIRP